MIFSVSDKGGLEEKKFCPMYYQAQIRSYISTAVPSAVSQGAYDRTLTYTNKIKKMTNK